MDMIDQAFNLMIYLKGKPMPYSLHHLKHSPFHILCRLPIERAPIHPAFDHLLFALRVHLLFALRVHLLFAFRVNLLFALRVHLLFALRVHLLFALRVHSDGGVPGQNREAQKRDYSSTKGRSGLGQQSQRSGA
jgi:hypothetical protein